MLRKMGNKTSMVMRLTQQQTAALQIYSRTYLWQCGSTQGP